MIQQNVYCILDSKHFVYYNEVGTIEFLIWLILNYFLHFNVIFLHFVKLDESFDFKKYTDFEDFKRKFRYLGKIFRQLGKFADFLN